MIKKDKLIIEQDENFVRDVKSSAVLNSDLTSLQKYRAKRKRDLEIMETVSEVKEIKEEVAELKNLIHQLIEKVK